MRCLYFSIGSQSLAPVQVSSVSDFPNKQTRRRDQPIDLLRDEGVTSCSPDFPGCKNRIIANMPKLEGLVKGCAKALTIKLINRGFGTTFSSELVGKALDMPFSSRFRPARPPQARESSKIH